MFKDSVEHDMIARVTQADYHLMRELAASHGLAFAAAFRIEYANEVARAMQIMATSSCEGAPGLFSTEPTLLAAPSRVRAAAWILARRFRSARD